jgi:hypothetical protein
MNLAATFTRLTRTTRWAADGDPLLLRSDAHHPQGMVRIDRTWWISTVDTARAKGWVLAVDADTGELVDRRAVGDDVRFHPGGMDFDGTALWLACAEYTPRSTATIARLDPRTDEPPEVVFAVDDHVGAVVRLGPLGDLVGWNWGSRRFLRWSATDGSELDRARNPGHFVDHQDGQWLEQDLVLCGGVGVGVGGLGVLRGDDLTMQREVPFFHRSPVTQRPATQNPIFAEGVDDDVVVHLLPDDGEQAAIYRYVTRGPTAATPRR